jgi:hypothetical protein
VAGGVLVIDDALLLRVLAGLAEGEISDVVARSDVFTTGSWYYRLARAIHSPPLGWPCPVPSPHSRLSAGFGCWLRSTICLPRSG